MSKKRDDLKERLKALRVNEPLKLNGEMKPPVARKEVPQNEAPPMEATEKKAARIEVPQNASAEPKSKAYIEAPRFENAQVEATQNKVAQTEVPKNVDAIPEAAQNKLTQNEATQREGSTPQGFFKLSHGVFAEPLLRDLSGDCFRLFLWLSSRAWRYPTSGGVVRASVGYIELHAGMSHATISRGLKVLKEKGLITALEVDFKNGNLWQVSALACGHPGNDDRPPRSKAPQNEAAQIVDSGASKNESNSLKMRMQPPQKEQDLRSFKKVKNLKEVAKPVVFFPQPKNDEPAESWEEVLQSFESDLGPEEQSKIVNDYMAREYPHGFFPPMRVVRTLAARDWFTTTSGQRTVAC